MHPSVKRRILARTQSHSIQSVQLIQPLWNNYGNLSRIHLDGGLHSSVILKHIQIPQEDHHPKGFGNRFSRQRKITSYEVEQYWYQHYNNDIAHTRLSQTPTCLDTFHTEGEIFILLEDLYVRGFRPLSSQASWTDIDAVIQWLADFHGHFIQHHGKGLWDTGTYWHLATRPDEREELRGSILYHLAPFIDVEQQSSNWHTIIHGDAKVANFCFHTQNSTAAAVDFQYIGKGCGMSDLAYFVGSVMSETMCKEKEALILDSYFQYLRQALATKGILGADVEKEWRPLYHVAWADFQRFLLGWSPHHSKHTSYAQQCTHKTIDIILGKLLDNAILAAKDAGKYILKHWKNPINITSKGFESIASDIVTHVDYHAQEIIIQHLQPSIQKYKLGILAEETHDDQSRHIRHAFWTIDPLDGTRYFANGKEGFCVSIALVTQTGESILGVVFDPVRNRLYHSITKRGVYCNGKKIQKLIINNTTTRAADISLTKNPKYTQMQNDYAITFCGGAVANILHVMTHSHAFYAKAIRSSLGGCAIWDLAAVTLMLKELGGQVCHLDGSPLHLNRISSPYFHDVGLICTSAHLDTEKIQGML